MLKLLKYILLMTFFLVAPAAARAQYVIDKVCKDAVRTYRVDQGNGEPVISYNWILTDVSGSQLLVSAGTNSGAGSEIKITWSFDPGVYTLSVEKLTQFSCQVKELGIVEVTPVPIVDAGADQTVCVETGTLVSLDGAKVTDVTAAGVEWTTSGDGTFIDSKAVNPIYTPGPGDLLAGKVTLKLTAKSMGDDEDGCLQEDEIEIKLSPKPLLVITNPKAVCEPDGVDLTAASVTVGSTKPIGVEPTYWMDAATTIALANPNHVIVSGTYYIKLGDNVNCQDIQPVIVTINKQPNLVIKDPLAVCEPSTVNLAASYITAGSDPGLTFSYWNDASATSPLANYNAVSSNGTFYIKAVIGAECSSSIKPVTVSIIQKSEPQFNILNLLCQNSTPPDLPTISTDNITGSWNPSVISTSSLGDASYVFTPNPGECALPTLVNITITDNIVPAFSAIGPFCVGESPTPLPLTSNNGIKGTWNPATISTTTSGTNNYIFTPDPDPGQCANPLPIQIKVTDPVTPTFDPIDPICQNSANPLPGKSIEGIPGSWSPAFSSATEGLTTYTFTPNNSFCFKTTTVDVVVNPPIVITETHVNLDYSVTPIGSINLTVSGGSGDFSYSWTGPNGFTSSSKDLIGLAEGSYAVTVVDNLTNCQEIKTIILTSFVVPLTVTTNNTLETCPGSGDATATAIASGGTSPYFYQWENGQTGQTIGGLTAGTYNVTVTDADGTSIPASVSIPKATSKFGFNPTYNNPCFGEKAYIEIYFTNVPNGLGLIDVYYDGGKFPDLTIIDNYVKIDNVDVRTYNNVRIQINGCWSDGIPLYIKYPDYTLAAVGKNPLCAGDNGSIDLSFTYVLDGFYEILYDGGSLGMVEVKGGKASVSVPPGEYNNLKIVVESCPTPDGVSVKINEMPALTPPTVEIVQPDCDIPAGTIKVLTPLPSAGITYTLKGTNPVVLPQTNTTGVFAGLAAGDYDLFYTDAMGCTSTPAVSIKINAHPVTPADPIAIVVAPECEKSPIQTLNANSGIFPPPAGVVIVWYDALTGGNAIANPILNTTTTITYFAEATNGECVSKNRTPVTLTLIPTPPAPVSKGDISACESSPLVILDARDAIDATGKNIVWYDKLVGGNVVAAPTLNAVRSVTYYAEDVNGVCASSPRTAVTLSIYPLPVKPVAVVSVAPRCIDTSGVIEVKSPIGSVYNYSIDNGAYQSSMTFNNQTPGVHNIRVKNMITNCESGLTSITVPDIPPVPHITNLTAEDCICYGDSGKLNFEFANVVDGTYVIVYVGGQFNNVKVVNGKASIMAPADTYNVLAIEANGCTSPENWNVEIKQPDQISVSATITEIDLKSKQKGEINLTITGGTGPYQTIWQPNPFNGFAGATTEDIKNLDAGVYVVSVTDANGCQKTYSETIPKANMPPIATDDEFTASCGVITGNLVYTDNGSGVDSDPDNDPISIDTTPIKNPSHGTLTIHADGSFEYVADPGRTGDDSFRYQIFDIKKNPSIPATVTIHIVPDTDGDGIVDEFDPDADGDGILNVDESTAGGDWKKTDSDGDGYPNYLDIDSDNDGIVDNIEVQSTPGYNRPSGTDKDHNGIDDSYDPAQGGISIVPVDTDGDGIPDFLDVDSDGDGVPDYIEGHDLNADGKPDYVSIGKDSDGDGLDDGFDTFVNVCTLSDNAIASNAAIQDFDGDGIKDWRDEDDDDDGYLTRFEDMNGDGDFSNDTFGHPGHPEYLWKGRDCDLFIPNAFSPNGDNIHDYFQIYCTNDYPNAKLYIFDQLGNKLYEKEHYGNLQFWGSYDRAWWDGRTANRAATTTNGGMVSPGTYYYVLQLGNGDVRKSFVFVSY